MLCEKLKELGLFSLEERKLWKQQLSICRMETSEEVIKKKPGSYSGVWCKGESMSIS